MRAARWFALWVLLITLVALLGVYLGVVATVYVALEPMRAINRILNGA